MHGMKNISEIEQAVRCLSRGQRRRLLDWLAGELDLEMGVAEPVTNYGSSAESQDFFSLDEYFELEERSSILHEYVAGAIFDMADPSQAHEIIAMNLAAPIHAHLRDRPCRIYQGRRLLQLRVLADDLVYRPDVWVACGEMRNGKGDYVDEPCLVVEVLSPSTARFDRREKVNTYREVPSIKEYVLLAQQPAWVRVYRRAEQWQPQTIEALEDVLDLQSVELSIPVANIYKGVPEGMRS